MTSVVFQHLECVEHKNNICIIGRADSGKSVAVMIENVKPHLCVRNEAGWTVDRFQMELNKRVKNVWASNTVLGQMKDQEKTHVSNHFKLCNGNDELVTVEAFMAQDISEYREDGCVAFFKCTVKSKRFLYMVKQVLRNQLQQTVLYQQNMKRIKITDNEQRYFDKQKVQTVTSRMRVGMFNRTFTIYNDQVDFMLQWMIDQDMYSCAWLRATGTQTHTKITSCDVELMATSIEQMDKEGLAPWRMFSYDIESLPPPRGNTGKYDFPSAEKDPVVTIGGVLQIGSDIKQYVWILRPFGDEVASLPAFTEPQDCDYRPETTTIFNFSKESKMLVHFFDWCVTMDVDIIQGHNCNRFDNTYMLRRYEVLFQENPVWGRMLNVLSLIKEKTFSSSQKGTNKQYHLTLPGRVVLDSYDIMKDQHNEASYKLGDLSATYLGTNKVALDYDQIYPKYHSLNGRIDLAVYCVKDAWLVYKLLDKLCKFTVILQMSNVTGIGMKAIMSRGQGIRTIALMLRYAKERDPQLMLPRLANQRKTKKVYRLVQKKDKVEMSQEVVEVEQTFQGATVVEPDKGFYKDCVSCLDFASLYPSIMQAMNMSYETLCYRDTIEEHNWKQDKDVRTVPDCQLIDGKVNITIDLDNPSFIVKEKRVGLLPEILGKVLAERKKVKKMRKKQDPTGVMYKVLDGRQLGLKVVANSIYGFTGAAFGFLPCKDIAQSVTKYGRGLILQTKSIIENHPEWGVKHQCKCVYGDSVSGSTPLLLNVDGRICIMAIRDLALDRPTYTWTENGWTRITNIIKHKLATHKKMLQIGTHTGIIRCTNDHSLVTDKGHPISPNDVVVGTRLMHSYPEVFNGEFQTIEHHFARVFEYKGVKYNTGKEAATANHLAGQPSRGKWIEVSRTVVIDDDMAKLMGMFMGDGSCGSYSCKSGGKCSWAINNADLVLLTSYQVLCTKLFPEYSFKLLPTLSSSGVYKLVVSTPLLRGIKRFVSFWRPLFYNSSREKKVPDVILNSPLSVREQFLQGLHDADGTKHCKHYEISQKGQESCAGIYYLLRSVGHHKIIVGSRRDKPNIFRLRTRVQTRKALDAVKKIAEIPYEEYVYDLSTENHHFHAGIGNMIVHNTDSVFVHMKRTLINGATDEEMVEKAHKMGEIMADYVTKNFLPPIFLEYEKTYLPYLLLKKKRYAGMKNEPGLPRKLHIKGLESVRRDFAPLLVDTQKRVLNALIKEQDEQKACDIVKQVVNDLYMNKIPLELLIMSKKLSRPVEEYKSKAAHVTLTKRLIEELGPEKAPVAGDRVPYVIHAGIGGTSDRACTPEEIRQGKYVVDRDYYLDRQLKKPLGRILERVISNPSSLFQYQQLFVKKTQGYFASWVQNGRKRVREEKPLEKAQLKKKKPTVDIRSFFKNT